MGIRINLQINVIGKQNVEINLYIFGLMILKNVGKVIFLINGDEIMVYLYGFLRIKIIYNIFIEYNKIMLKIFIMIQCLKIKIIILNNF